MAQIILNLEFDEILRAFTTGAKNEGLRLLLQKGLNAMLERESSEQLGAKRYEDNVQIFSHIFFGARPVKVSSA